MIQLSIPSIWLLSSALPQIDLLFQPQHSGMMFRCPRHRPTGGHLNHVPRASCSRERGPDFLTDQVKSHDAEVACGLGRKVTTPRARTYVGCPERPPRMLRSRLTMSRRSAPASTTAIVSATASWEISDACATFSFWLFDWSRTYTRSIYQMRGPIARIQAFSLALSPANTY